MRWLITSLGAIVFLWVVFLLSPYWAFYSLAQAVEAKDIAGIEERVNFRAVRLSLSRQIGAAYAKVSGAERQAGAAAAPSLSSSAAAAVADPLIAPYVTPETIIALLTKGSLDLPGAPPAVSAAASAATAGGGLVVPQFSFERLKQLFLATESRGFRGFIFALPPDRPVAERFRLVFRLGGLSNNFTWRLVGLELPAQARDRLVLELLKRKEAGSLQ